MNNKDFLEVIKASFKKFLTTGSNSNEKLKVLLDTNSTYLLIGAIGLQKQSFLPLLIHLIRP